MTLSGHRAPHAATATFLNVMLSAWHAASNSATASGAADLGDVIIAGLSLNPTAKIIVPTLVSRN